ncbi:putative kinase domain protein [Anopheles sinensis]|uniref:Putative kinase domain protein n=1 Tax=Anopheles sinensis TaxID=74873 RepID=A0A084W4C1_ANOSI|nr:putative kinase domain protein [Anopheles sinensis]
MVAETLHRLESTHAAARDGGLCVREGKRGDVYVSFLSCYSSSSISSQRTTATVVVSDRPSFFLPLASRMVSSIFLPTNRHPPPTVPVKQQKTPEQETKDFDDDVDNVLDDDDDDESRNRLMLFTFNIVFSCCTFLECLCCRTPWQSLDSVFGPSSWPSLARVRFFYPTVFESSPAIRPTIFRSAASSNISFA